MLDPSWMEEAKCLGKTDLMFIEHEDGLSLFERSRGVRQAKEVCTGCPVLLKCREFGMTQKLGVWGGLSATERQALRRQQGRRELMPMIRIRGKTA
jgi:WhiB family redox-sensing transcriptional regulator